MSDRPGPYAHPDRVAILVKELPAVNRVMNTGVTTTGALIAGAGWLNKPEITPPNSRPVRDGTHQNWLGREEPHPGAGITR